LNALAEREPQLLAERGEYSKTVESLRSLLGTLRTAPHANGIRALDYDSIRLAFEQCSTDARAAELELHKSESGSRAANQALRRRSRRPKNRA
jgi:hypothetical protein